MALETPTPTPPTPGAWSWVKTPSGHHRLLSPDGLEAATVYHTFTWFVFGPNGDIGQNDIGRGSSDEDRLRDAKWCAEHAAKVSWYESGWADPRRGIHPGTRVKIKEWDHSRHGPEAFVLKEEGGRFLVCTLPSPGEVAWEWAVASWAQPLDLEKLPPSDLPSPVSGEGEWDGEEV